jgi:GDSL-like lipase/acylhydrolase family protein
MGHKLLLLLRTVSVAGLLLIASFAPALSVGAAPERLDAHAYPVVPAIRGSVATKARSLVRLGRRYGNRSHVFSKIGDSITQWGFFMMPIGNGGLRLADHGELQGVVDWFAGEVARTNNSFANESLAAHGGWKSGDLLDPQQADPGCGGLTPVDCELRNTRPSVALIMIGTNDVETGDLAGFRANLNRIVSIVEAYGVVPVISTIPYRLDNQDLTNRVAAYNDVIIRIAAAHRAPLWNYFLAMEPLPSNGLTGDGIHPSVPPDQNTAVFDGFHLQYGFTMRNLTALQVLNNLLPVLR